MAFCTYPIAIASEAFYSANPAKPVFTCVNLSNCKTFLDLFNVEYPHMEAPN
jgi:hypothetical protein